MSRLFLSRKIEDGNGRPVAGCFPGASRHDVPLYGFLQRVGVRDGVGLGQRVPFSQRLKSVLGTEQSAGLEGDVGHASYPRDPSRTHLPLGSSEDLGREAYKFPGLDDGSSEDGDGTAATAAAATAAAAAAAAAATAAADIDLSSEAWLRGRLTPDERAQFESAGFLLVRDALPPEQHTALLAQVERLREAAIATGQNDAGEMTHAAAFSRLDGAAFQRAPVVQRL
jgi:hypothetical protein|eukprot:COSAG01_NODE_6644_length_3566_cov_4.395443_5_plen_226_part_00